MGARCWTVQPQVFSATALRRSRGMLFHTPFGDSRVSLYEGSAAIMQGILGITTAVNVEASDAIHALRQKIEASTGIGGAGYDILFQGKPMSALSTLFREGITKESTLTMVMRGRGGMASERRGEGQSSALVGTAFRCLGIFRRCMHRVHRFSPGVEGRDLLRDANRCASLGHWSLITTGRVDPSTVLEPLLYAACHAGRLDVVRSLVTTYGLHVDSRDIGGWTALHTAMVRGEEAVARTLVGLGAKNVPSDDGVRPSSLCPSLWRRIRDSHSTEESFPSEDDDEDDDDNEEDDDDESWSVPETPGDAIAALYPLIVDDSVSTALLCRRLRVTVDRVGSDRLFCLTVRFEWSNWTILSAAATAGRFSLCRMCLEWGADADGTRAVFVGDTPLALACQLGRLDIVQLLVDRGAADVNKLKCGTASLTPLHIVAERNHLDVARFLLSRGADVTAFTLSAHDTALFTACQEGHAAMVRLLLEYGADPRADGRRGREFLFAACFGRHLEVVLLLLQAGVDPAASGCGILRSTVAGVLGACPLARALRIAETDRDAGIEAIQRLVASDSE